MPTYVQSVRSVPVELRLPHLAQQARTALVLGFLLYPVLVLLAIIAPQGLRADFKLFVRLAHIVTLAPRKRLLVHRPIFALLPQCHPLSSNLARRAIIVLHLVWSLRQLSALLDTIARVQATLPLRTIVVQDSIARLVRLQLSHALQDRTAVPPYSVK